MITTRSPKSAAPNAPKAPSPSEALAKKVVARLVGKKLLTDELGSKVLPRIAFHRARRSALRQRRRYCGVIRWPGYLTTLLRVQFYLEDLLGCPVDLVTEKALRQELRPYIEREAVNV